MKTKATALIACILIAFKIYAQKIVKVNLTEVCRSNPFSYQSIPLKKDEFDTAFIDSSKYSILLKGIAHYQPEQYIWGKYKQGIYGADTVRSIRTKNADTGKLCVNAIREGIYVLVLSDKLSGDSLLLFSNKLSPDLSAWHTVNFKKISTNWLDIRNPETATYRLPEIEICYNGQTIKHPVCVFPLLDKTDKKLARQISFLSGYYTSGEFVLNGKRCKLSAGNIQSQHFFDSTNTGIRFEEQNQKQASAPYKIGDTIDLAENSVLLYRITPDATMISFKILGTPKKNTTGYNEGYQYSAFNLNDITDASAINTAELLQSKKYLLLDFWGTWCAPCIKSIPDLRTVYDRYNKDVQIISIAAEQKADTAKVLASIADYNMPWKHLMFAKNVKTNKNFWLGQYRITTYPTCILINSQGLIVLRRTGLEGTDAIKQFLVKNLGY